MRTEVGGTDERDLEAETDMDTFFALASGQLEPQDALAHGRVRIEGAPETLERCFDVLSFARRMPSAA